MKLPHVLCAGISASFLSLLSANAALLVNCQFASQTGSSGGPGNNGVSTTPQVGEAVLGFTTHDQWNQIGNPYFNTGNIQGGGSLYDSTGNATGINVQLFSTGGAGYGQVTTSGSATDSGTAALMTSDWESFNYAPSVRGLEVGLDINNIPTADIGQPFDLVIYAAGPVPLEEVMLIDPDYNYALSGGNTASALSVTGASRKISAGPGVAYAEFNGVISGTQAYITIITPDDKTIVNYLNGFQLQIGVVPEPSTWGLLGIGILIILVSHRRIFSYKKCAKPKI